MATGLHARKKNLHLDPGIVEIAPSSGEVARSRRRHGVLHRMLGSEVGRAVEAVLLFLLCGLFLGYFILHHQHRKVVLQVMSNPLAHAGAALKGRVGFRHHFYSGNPRTVTVIMPSVVNPKGRTRRLNSIFETWGPSARAVYVVHNVSEFPQAAHHSVLSENTKPDDPYSYPQLLLVPPSIGFDDGLPRLNYVIRAVYQEINPDFAFFVNDHTFVIPEHLCKYLEHKNPDEHMYDGHAMKNNADIFNSGAAGYILSRQSMKGLVEKWDEDDPACSTKGANKWLQGNPGLATTKCLKDAFGVVAKDTRRHEKWHRFHAFPLTRVVSGAVDDWYKKKHQDMHKLMETDESYGVLLSGVDCCAQDTVSFHYVEFKESLAMFAVREALLKNPHISDHELKNLMIAEWPKDNKEVGGYSHRLPPEGKTDVWKDLLVVMRAISNRHNQRDC